MNEAVEAVLREHSMVLRIIFLPEAVAMSVSAKVIVLRILKCEVR